jgi:UDP-N-acetylmuramoylalanine--D-glutamate ligase
MEIQGKRCLLLGYGREGKSVHRFLVKNPSLFASDLEISIADRNAIEVDKDLPQPQHIFSGENYLSDISSHTTIIRSPGIPLQLTELQEAQQLGVHLSSLSNLFFSLARGRVIGITGTKGKSTTSSLIYHLLQSRNIDVRLVGNIGVPALDLLDGHDQNTVFVVELSSFQLEDLRYSPNISVFLEVFEEHLDHHRSFEKYLQAKLNILAHQSDTDIAIFNSNHAFRKRIEDALCSRPVTFCRELSSDMKSSGSVDYLANEKLILSRKNTDDTALNLDISGSPLCGRGNVENVMAAVTAVLSIDEAYAAEIENSLSKYTPLAHRLEYVACLQGIDFYNDSLATIPQATEAAISGLGERVQTVILGGFDRGISYSPLAHFLLSKKGSLRNLILFPSTGDKIWNEMQKVSASDSECFTAVSVSTMSEAVAEAFRLTDNERICLLSPASSSLNLFRDYQDRGDQFRREIERLSRSRSSQD